MINNFVKCITLAIFATLLISCSTEPRHRDTEKSVAPPPAQTTAEAVATPVVPVATPVTATAHAAHHAPEGVDPDQSLKWLKNGNLRFVKGAFRKDGRSKADVKRLSTGQKPHTIVLSCSDSRVPPEHVFDQALGEIFVVRVAGEALSDSVIASVEYAAEHLGSRLIIVMGHTSCGAVKAALTTPVGQSAGSPSLDALVNDIRPRIASFKNEGENAGASKNNAIEVANDLLRRSKIVSDLVQSGQVKVVSALYHLDSGVVDF